MRLTKKELNVVLWQTKGWRVGRGKTMTRTASSALRWQTKGNKWGKPTYQRHGNRAEARTFEHSRFGPWKGLQSTSSTADTWKSVHNKFDNELWNFCQIVTLFGIVGNPCPTCHSWNLFCCHKFWNNNYCHLYPAKGILEMGFHLHNKRLSQRKTYFILAIVIILGKDLVWGLTYDGLRKASFCGWENMSV